MSNRNSVLKLIIAGDNKGAVTAIQGTGSALGGLTGQASGLGGVLAGAFSVGAVTAFANKSVDAYTDIAGSVAQVKRLTGESAEDASLLVFTAQQSGVEASKAAVGWRTFAKNIDNGKVAAEGIVTKDSQGNLLSFEKILGNLADKIQALPPGIQRTALAQRVLGRSGADLVKVLQNGSAGIEDARKEMQSYGLEFNDAGLAKYQKFIAAQRDLKAAFLGIEVELAEKLTPALAGVEEGFAHLPKPVRDTAATLAVLAAASTGLVVSAGLLVPIWQRGAQILGIRNVAETEAVAESVALSAADTEVAVATAAATAAQEALAEALASGVGITEASDAASAAYTEQLIAQAAASTEAGGGAAAAGGATLGLSSAVAVAAAGWISYQQTTKFLEGHFGKFHGDTQQMGDDLEGLAKGTKTADEALGEVGGSVDGLADKIGNANRDGLGRRLGDVGKIFGGLASFNPALVRSGAGDVFGLRQTNADLAAVEGQLISMVKDGHIDEARTAYGKLVVQLEATGLTAEQIGPQFSGFLDALHSSSTEADSAAQAEDRHTAALKRNTDALSKHSSNAKGLFDAQQSLRSATDEVVSAEDDLNAAQADAAGISDDAVAKSKAISDARHDEADALDGVTEAQQTARDARAALNDEEAQAKQRIVDLTEATRKAAQSQRDATLALHEAQAENAKVLRDPHSTALDREKARVGLQDAQGDLTGATKDHADAVRDETAAKAAGVEGDKQVVAAKKRVADADAGIVDAEQKVNEAHQRVTDAVLARDKFRKDSTDKVREAVDKVNTALYDAVVAHAAVVTAEQGTAAGIVDLRNGLSGLAQDFGVGSPLTANMLQFADDLSAALRGFRLRQSQGGVVVNETGQVLSGPPSPDGTVPGQVGPRGPKSLNASSGEGGPVNVTINQQHLGTPRQVGRASAAAAGKTLDRLFAGTR